MCESVPKMVSSDDRICFEINTSGGQIALVDVGIYIVLCPSRSSPSFPFLSLSFDICIAFYMAIDNKGWCCRSEMGKGSAGCHRVFDVFVGDLRAFPWRRRMLRVNRMQMKAREMVSEHVT